MARVSLNAGEVGLNRSNSTIINNLRILDVRMASVSTAAKKYTMLEIADIKRRLFKVL